jgi:hypothetical protein
VRLAEQWQELQSDLPRAWESASFELSLDDSADADRAALLLGPAAPARRGTAFTVHVARESRPGATSATLLQRVLERLDREGVRGRLTVTGSESEPAAPATSRAGPAAAQWDDLVGALPPDWSHLLAQIDLASSDYIERAALLLIPTNPRLAGGPFSMRFRCARRHGYGVAPQMARRCFERLDQERITGRVTIFHLVSDAHPVATQGPVFRIAGKSV